MLFHPAKVLLKVFSILVKSHSAHRVNVIEKALSRVKLEPGNSEMLCPNMQNAMNEIAKSTIDQYHTL